MLCVGLLSVLLASLAGGTTVQTTADECHDYVTNDLTCDAIDDVCSDPVGQLVCRRHCGKCSSTGPPLTTPQGQPPVPCNDRLGLGLECSQIPGICLDQFAQQLCPSHCGYCEDDSNSSDFLLDECVDNIVFAVDCGAIPDVCNDTHGRLLCRRHCNLCSSSQPTTPPLVLPPGVCYDRVGAGLRCHQLPGICNDQHAELLCPQHCGHCDLQQGALRVDCSADEDPGVCRETFCQDADEVELAVSQCPRYCGFCDQRTNQICEAEDDPKLCKDDFCDVNEEVVARNLCPHFCGFCDATTTDSPDTLDCMDHLLHDKECDAIPNVCDNLYSHVACRRYCDLCSGPTPQPQPELEAPVSPDACVDYVGYGLTCQELPGVCTDQDGVGPNVLCPKHCGVCDPPTSPPPTTTSVQPLDCTDHLLHGKSCSDIPGVCDDLFGHLACRRFCDACTGPEPQRQPELDAPVGPGDCVDYMGYGLTCLQLPGVCQAAELIGPNILCPKQCGICQSSTTPGATAETQTSAQTQTSPTTAATTQTTEATATTPEPTTTTMETSEATTAPPDNTEATTTTMATTDATTTTAVCEDLLKPPHSCADLEMSFVTLCQTDNGRRTCPRHCGLCPSTTPKTTTPTTTTATTTTTTTSSTPSPCVDLLVSPHNCAELERSFTTLCQDPNGQKTCLRYCGICVDETTTPDTTTSTYGTTTTTDTTLTTIIDTTTTTTTDTTTTTTNNIPCIDVADADVCDLPDFCNDPYAHGLCRKACGFCNEDCEDSIDCQHLIGAGGQYSDVSTLCDDSLSVSVCQRTCGCP